MRAGALEELSGWSAVPRIQLCPVNQARRMRAPWFPGTFMMVLPSSPNRAAALSPHVHDCSRVLLASLHVRPFTHLVRDKIRDFLLRQRPLNQRVGLPSSHLLPKMRGAVEVKGPAGPRRCCPSTCGHAEVRACG